MPTFTPTITTTFKASAWRGSAADGATQRRQVIALVMLCAASLYLTWSLFAFAQDVGRLLELQRKRDYPMKRVEEYSLVGADHPPRIPIPKKYVKMTVEESVRFGLTEPESYEEWLWTATVGDGHVRVTNDPSAPATPTSNTTHRMFAVAMFHELHCMRSIRQEIEKGKWSSLSAGRQRHLLHCFNYLRQYTLCAADTTLEKGDWRKRDFARERKGGTHTCVDWDPAYKFMTERWNAWEDYRIAHGIPDHPEIT